jgi:hypothetical protein
MKFTSVAVAFTLLNAAFAAPAKRPEPIPSGWPLGFPSPTGFPIPTGFPGVKHHEYTALPTGVIPTGSIVSAAPLATGTSPKFDAPLPRKMQRRSVVRRGLQYEPLQDEPSSPHEGIPTGSLPVPTGQFAVPTGRLPIPTGHAF